MRDFQAEIGQSLKGKGGFRGSGTYYVFSPHWSDIVPVCEELDLAVVGIEVFELIGHQIRPRMDLIRHFRQKADNWDEYRIAVNANARAFLEGIEPNTEMVATLLPIDREDFVRPRRGVV